MWELQSLTNLWASKGLLQEYFLALIEMGKSSIHANDKHEEKDEGNAVFLPRHQWKRPRQMTEYLNKGVTSVI
jgi:hypothetical protein